MKEKVLKASWYLMSFFSIAAGTLLARGHLESFWANIQCGAPGWTLTAPFLLTGVGLLVFYKRFVNCSWLHALTFVSWYLIAAFIVLEVLLEDFWNTLYLYHSGSLARFIEIAVSSSVSLLWIVPQAVCFYWRNMCINRECETEQPRTLEPND